MLKNNVIDSKRLTAKIVKKVFPVKTYERELNFDKFVPIEHRSQIIRNSWQFVWGKSTQIEHTVENLEHVKLKVPLDALNLFKHIIVSKVPTMAFGWLVPTYMSFDIPQKIVHQKTYVNVIPLDEYQKDDHVSYLMLEKY